jgi:hypothetical protein
MATSNFNLRGIPLNVMDTLKKEAKKLRISINTLILKMIERSLDCSRKKFIHHDLDHLAGSWSFEEAKIFNKSIKSFEKNDKRCDRKKRVGKR